MNRRRVTRYAAVGVLAVVGVFSATASAAAPQGEFTGGANVGSMKSIGITRVSVHTAIVDGEQVDVGLNNDKSGDCDGDSGSVDVRYGFRSVATIPILCAHFTTRGNAMVMDWYDPDVGGYVEFRVRDLGSPVSGDVLEYQTLIAPRNSTDEATVRSWVNLGQRVGNPNGGPALIRVAGSTGDYHVTAVPTK